MLETVLSHLKRRFGVEAPLSVILTITFTFSIKTLRSLFSTINLCNYFLYRDFHVKVVDKAEEPSINQQNQVADSDTPESVGPTGIAKGKPLMEEDTSRYQVHINCY